MNDGTEWVEPGTGATVAELWIAILQRGPGDEVQNAKNAKRYRESRRLTEPEDCNVVTNLSLTGAPLYADDLKRIAEAK